MERLRREFPFDVIDAHYLYPDAYAAVRIGKDLGVPVVSSARGSDVNLIARMPDLAPLVREVRHRSGSSRSRALARPCATSGADVTVIERGGRGTVHPWTCAARRDLELDDGPR
jgi:hypothetical protein